MYAILCFGCIKKGLEIIVGDRVSGPEVVAPAIPSAKRRQPPKKSVGDKIIGMDKTFHGAFTYILMIGELVGYVIE